MSNLIYYIIKIFIGEEGVQMMAMLFAQKIILGKITFKDVPTKLRDQVKEILIESGCEDLIIE